MAQHDVISRIRQLKPWLSDHGVTRVRVFGSHARGDARADSDVDIVADFDDPPGLFELCRLERTLSERLGAPVDLAVASGLKPRLAEVVEREGVDV